MRYTVSSSRSVLPLIVSMVTLMTVGCGDSTQPADEGSNKQVDVDSSPETSSKSVASDKLAPNRRQIAIAELEKLGIPNREFNELGLNGLMVSIHDEFVTDDGRISDTVFAHLQDVPKLLLGLSSPRVSDLGLEQLKSQTNIEMLTLQHTNVTDDGLRHLSEMKQLMVLSLTGTKVTDTGVAHLAQLHNLIELDLDCKGISDAGLPHLKGLTKLDSLALNETQITDDGLVNLKGLTKLKYLELANTKVTDAGLDELKGLTALEELVLVGTQVTDDGVKRFNTTLPNCKILLKEKD